MLVPIAQITVTSSREALREDTIRHLMEAVQRGDPTPNIKLMKMGELFALVYGEHRLEAFKRLGKTGIEADVVTKPLTESEIAVERWRENHHRSDFSPREQTNLIRSIMGDLGIDQEAVAELLDISPAKVAKLLKVFKRLATDLQDALDAGKLNFTESYDLAALDDHAHQRELAALCMQGKLGRDGLKKRIKVLLGQRVRKSKPKQFEADGVTLTVDGDMDADTLLERLKELAKRFRKGAKFAEAPDTAPIIL